MSFYETTKEAALRRENEALRIEVRTLSAKLARLRGTEIKLKDTTYFRIMGLDGWYYTDEEDRTTGLSQSTLSEALDRIEALVLGRSSVRHP